MGIGRSGYLYLQQQGRSCPQWSAFWAPPLWSPPSPPPGNNKRSTAWQYGNSPVGSVRQFYQGHDARTCLQFFFIPFGFFSVCLEWGIIQMSGACCTRFTSFRPLVSTIMGPLLPAMVSILRRHFLHKSTQNWSFTLSRLFLWLSEPPSLPVKASQQT